FRVDNCSYGTALIVPVLVREVDASDVVEAECLLSDRDATKIAAGPDSSARSSINDHALLDRTKQERYDAGNSESQPGVANCRMPRLEEIVDPRHRSRGRRAHHRSPYRDSMIVNQPVPFDAHHLEYL